MSALISLLISLLSGKKTYLVAIAAAVIQGLVLAGKMDQETANAILAFLGIGGVATMRAAIKKAEIK